MKITLAPEQLELFETLVQAQRSTPRDERQKILVARMLQGDLLVHPAIPQERAEIYFGDLEILERYGLVYITYPGKDPSVDVTPGGYSFYDSLSADEPDLDQPDNQEDMARELIAVLDAIKKAGFRDEQLIERAKALNARLAPSYAKVYGAVPLISTDYPPRIWWSRAREQASQALAVAAAGWVSHERSNPHLAMESRKVFIVHGREHGLKEATARLVERLGYEAVILHERPNRGRTVIEKFEQEANAAFAVVLLTPDDEGRLRAEGDKSNELVARARQNVVWEFGYFSGALGRARVAALVADGELEQPSDLQGVIYIPVATVEDMGWRIALAREMRAAGLDVDLNKLSE